MEHRADVRLSEQWRATIQDYFNEAMRGPEKVADNYNQSFTPSLLGG